MERLICSTNHVLKRRSSSLVRTPIQNVVLTPVEMAYYSVAGAYDSGQWPIRGFHGNLTQASAYGVGYDCLTNYNNPTNSLQIWRQVTTSHKPEFCWYQGAYATSAPNPTGSCEAYVQLCAYKFTIPSTQLYISSASVNYILGGEITCYGSAGAGSTNNTIGRSDTSVHSYATFYCADSLQKPSNYYGSSSYPAISDDITSKSNTFKNSGYSGRGYRDLWAFTSSTQGDGAIPKMIYGTSEAHTSLSVSSASFLNYANSIQSFWIVVAFPPVITSSTNYEPMYIAQNVGYWLCISLWDLTMTVTLSARD